MLNSLDLSYLPKLPIEKSAKILDFGCGRGEIVQYLISHGYQNVVGIDIRRAENEITASDVKSKIQIVPDSLDYLKKHAGEFDCIIAKDVLYYFDRKDVVQVCHLMALALKPGGRLLVEVVNGAIASAVFTSIKDIGILNMFTESSIEQALTECGLSDVEVYAKPRVLRGIKSLIFFAIQSLWFALLRLVYFLERGRDPRNPRIMSKSLVATGIKRK